jgi:hypothetical protein
VGVKKEGSVIEQGECTMRFSSEWGKPRRPGLCTRCLFGHVKPTCSALLPTLAMASSQPSRRRVSTSRDAEVDGPAVLSMSDLRLAQCYQFVEEVRPIKPWDAPSCSSGSLSIDWGRKLGVCNNFLFTNRSNIRRTHRSVWLGRDKTSPDNRRVALKVVHRSTRSKTNGVRVRSL